MSKLTISVLGGTGDLGGGLAYRWAKAGYPVIIGSRKEEGALEACAALKQRLPDASIQGMENSAAAQAGEQNGTGSNGAVLPLGNGVVRAPRAIQKCAAALRQTGCSPNWRDRHPNLVSFGPAVKS